MLSDKTRSRGVLVEGGFRSLGIVMPTSTIHVDDGDVGCACTLSEGVADG